MHHLTCGISSLLHSANLILFTVLVVHLILRISPHHSHHLRAHHLSLPRPFTPDSYSFRGGGLPPRILNHSTELSKHWRLFVLVFFLATFATLSWSFTILVHVILSFRIVSYSVEWMEYLSIVTICLSVVPFPRYQHFDSMWLPVASFRTSIFVLLVH